MHAYLGCSPLCTHHIAVDTLPYQEQSPVSVKTETEEAEKAREGRLHASISSTHAALTLSLSNRTWRLQIQTGHCGITSSNKTDEFSWREELYTAGQQPTTCNTSPLDR